MYQQCFAVIQSVTAAEARAWFFEYFEAASLGELEQRYPRGSRERHLLAEFLGFYESTGVLVSWGLLHEDVFFDAPFALELVWDKIGPIIEEWQRTTDDRGIWENVAWLGKRYQVWYDTRWRSKLKAVPVQSAPA